MRSGLSKSSLVKVMNGCTRHVLTAHAVWSFGFLLYLGVVV